MDRAVPLRRKGIGEGCDHLPRATSSQNPVVADVGVGSYGFVNPLFLQQYHGQTSSDELDYLPETSTVIHGGSAVEGAFQFQQEMISSSSSGRTFDLNSTVFSHQMDKKKRSASVDVANNNDKSLGRELVPYREGASQNKLSPIENCSDYQKHTLVTPESITLEAKCGEPLAVTVAVPGTNYGKRALARSTVSDRMRKAMINERLESLHSLLPHAGKDNKEAELEDVIDYVKYLRLQAKTLSRCKLGGEATHDPFIHLEGFGHYLVDQHMLTEPLEEILGQMMETDMSAAMKLLEAKGLYVMPMALAEGLS